MKTRINLIFLVLLLGIMLNGASIEKLRQRKDLISGYAKGDSREDVNETAKMELAVNMSDWWLEQRGIKSRISYGKRDQHQRMMRIWIDNTIEIIKISEDKDGSILYYIDEGQLAELFRLKEKEIIDLIVKGNNALEYNKLGIFFRNFYWALVENDILAGKKLYIGEEEWNSDRIIKKINITAEDLVLRVVGNHYEPGNRQLVFQVLHNRRPVNDLRLGVLLGGEYLDYSVSDRYFQVDMFGYEYEAINNVSVSIDVQDRSTGIWGEEVAELSAITGMDGYEAYRTIPLRNEEFVQRDWSEITLPIAADEFGEERLEHNIRHLLKSMHEMSEADKDIFEGAMQQRNYTMLQKKLNVQLIDLETRVKREDLDGFIYWRGFKVQITLADGMKVTTNLSIKTDRQQKIAGIWLGIKPLDYRLLKRSNSEGNQNRWFIKALEEIETQYTKAAYGDVSSISFGGVNHAEGWSYLRSEVEPLKKEITADDWKWVEIEDVKIEAAENGAVYSYRLLLKSDKANWEIPVNGSLGE